MKFKSIIKYNFYEVLKFWIEVFFVKKDSNTIYKPQFSLPVFSLKKYNKITNFFFW